MNENMAILESILFTTSDPLTFGQLQKILHVRKRELELLLAELHKRYQNPEHGIMLSDIGGYRLIVKPQYSDVVAQFTPHADLSRGLLRVLSLVAYHQPIKQSDIVKVVGNRTYDYVKELEERSLIKVEKKSRTKMLSTTPHFDEYFGANAEELKKGTLERKIKEEEKQEPTEGPQEQAEPSNKEGTETNEQENAEES